MAGNSIGEIFRVTTFGESHGVAVGAVIDGCPAGLEIDESFIQHQLDRRKPGQSVITTQRNESDTSHILSGVFEGKTLGTPICLLINNDDAKPQDYEAIKNIFRPSHADYTYETKYGIRDYRGGGRSSARITAASVAAGAIEIKSGYGLSVEAELKILRVIKKLKTLSPLTIKSTFLGAHAIPVEYKNNRGEYIRIVIEEMMPRIADEGLSDYCDVFCENGFFTPEETDMVLQAGWKYNLKPKIHANQLAISGGVQAGVRNKAISVDHLENIGDEEITALKNSNTIASMLPTAAFFLRLPYPPARKMIEENLAVTLASDFNPGSSPSGRMSFVVSLACIQMKMTPEEAINASTLNGAAAIELSNDFGSITIGKKANLIITQAISSLANIPYLFGRDCIDRVIINGE